ncbi:MAG: 6-bladed beta-propeller [Bacteroidota bacterium]
MLKFKEEAMLMKTKTFKTIFFFGVLVFTACENKPKQLIDISAKTKINSVSEVLEFEQAILIKTPEGLGQDVKVIFTEKNIIVVDRTFTNDIYLYNYQGDLEFRIESGIGGPKEYTQASDVTYNDQNDILYVFSEEQYTIFGFDNTGKLVKKHKINADFYVHEIEVLYDEVFVFFADQDKSGKHQVNIYDFSNNELKKSFLKGSFHHIFLGNESSLWKNKDNDKVYVAPYFTNYVYSINERLELDSIYLKNSLPIDEIKHLNSFNVLKEYAKKNSEPYFVGYYKESNSFRCFLNYDTGSENAQIYLENKLNLKRINSNEINNDLTKTDIGLSNIVEMHQNKVFTMVSSEIFQHSEDGVSNLKNYFESTSIKFLQDENYSILNVYSVTNK